MPNVSGLRQVSRQDGLETWRCPCGRVIGRGQLTPGSGSIVELVCRRCGRVSLREAARLMLVSAGSTAVPETETDRHEPRQLVPTPTPDSAPPAGDPRPLTG
jgi:hypothetical protein